MTDQQQHPLTDTICVSIQDSIHPGDPWFVWLHPSDPEAMRAAADWQLKQVIEWLKTYTEDYLLEDYYGTYFLTEAFIENFKKAMRPTTTQEDN